MASPVDAMRSIILTPSGSPSGTKIRIVKPSEAMTPAPILSNSLYASFHDEAVLLVFGRTLAQLRLASSPLAQSRGKIRVPFYGALPDKRIDDGKAADAAAMLHVFAEQRVATGLDRSGDDQGVVERHAVLAGEGDGAGVRVQRDGQDVIERRAEQPERQFDLRPVMMKLAAGDVDELVQHLNADDTATAQAIHRPLFSGVRSRGVDENVGIEERLHRSFASSRSNL